MKRHEIVRLAVALAMLAPGPIIGPGLATAADLPSQKGTPVPPPAPIWSGLWLGGGAGFTWSNNANVHLDGYQNGWQNVGGVLQPTFAPYAYGVPANLTLNQTGFFGEGHLAYLWQGGSFVYGLKGEFGLPVGAHKTAAFPIAGLGYVPSVAEIGSDWRWVATAGPVLGYTLTPATLLYVSGGPALVQTDNSIKIGTAAQIASGWGTAGKALPGWYAEAGAKYQFAPGWAAGVKATYVNVGSRTFSAHGVAYGSNAVQSYVAKARPDAFAVALTLDRQLDFFGVQPSQVVFQPTGNIQSDLTTFRSNAQNLGTAFKGRVHAKRTALKEKIKADAGKVGLPVPAAPAPAPAK